MSNYRTNRYDRLHNKRKAAALKLSDNGRLWWIYQYIMAQGIPNAKSPMARRLQG